MTQPVEPTRLRPERILAPGSRYLKQRIIYYGEKKLMTFNTYIRQPYRPNGNERVMMITKGVEFRPDLVSYDVYGFSDNWWRILEANNIKDVWDFKAGRTIILPDRVI